MSEKYRPEVTEEKTKLFYYKKDTDFMQKISDDTPEIAAGPGYEDMSHEDWKALVADRRDKLLDTDDKTRELLVLEYLERIDDEALPQTERDACSMALYSLQLEVDAGDIVRRPELAKEAKHEN